MKERLLNYSDEPILRGLDSRDAAEGVTHKMEADPVDGSTCKTAVVVAFSPNRQWKLVPVSMPRADTVTFVPPKTGPLAGATASTSRVSSGVQSTSSSVNSCPFKLTRNLTGEDVLRAGAMHRSC